MLELGALCVRHLQDVDLALNAGECISIAGSSGAGKSLLLRAIADLEPFTGTLRLGGRSHLAFQPWDWRKRVGLLPATSQWWFDRVGPHFPEVHERWLLQLDLSPAVMDWEVGRLSSGERQRLAVLRLLANRPQVLLLDEPTANLDNDRATALERLLAGYREDSGAGVIWVTHDAGQARRVACRQFTIRGNTITEEGRT